MPKLLHISLHYECIYCLFLLALLMSNNKIPKFTLLISIVLGKSTVENLAPLNSLLELFTAKTCLNEIDFNLLIESTQASLEFGN